jgi:hypothetical protein
VTEKSPPGDETASARPPSVHAPAERCPHVWRADQRRWSPPTCALCGQRLSPDAPEVQELMARHARTLAARGGEEAHARRLLRSLFETEGWLDPIEAWALHEAARGAAPGRPEGPTVVELGSYRGRSTVALALGVLARGGGRVIAIDPHDDERDRRAFLDTLARSGVDSVVEARRLRSLEARPGVVEGSVDLLFVDASHRREDVLADVGAWSSALRPGATVAFNDPTLPGVRRALRDVVLAPGSPYRRPRLVLNTLLVEHRPGEPETPSERRHKTRARAALALGQVARSWRRRTGRRLPLVAVIVRASRTLLPDR